MHNTSISQKIFTLSAAAFFGVLLLAGCNENDEQRKFEEEAFSEPRNITSTDISGKVLNEDDDDWRIGPMFRGFIEVESPAFPNPAQPNRNIEIHFNITGVDAVSGMEVMIRDLNQNWLSIHYDQQTPLPTGLYDVQINPRSFSFDGSYENAKGIHRVFVFDKNSNLITYGDIRVE